PENVLRWINLDARGDLVGGPIQGQPFAVDEEHLNLEPVGCRVGPGSIVSPVCAHSSYFHPANTRVNRDILARIMQTIAPPSCGDRRCAPLPSSHLRL